MNDTNNDKPISNKALQASLDEVDKELRRFDEITNTIEEQQALSNLESEFNKEEE